MNTLELGRRMSEQWWKLLSKLGFPRERWLALDPLVRRATKTGFWLIVGIVLVAIGGGWNLTVLAAAAIVFPLVVIPWGGYPPGPWGIPGVLALAPGPLPPFPGGFLGSPP